MLSPKDIDFFFDLFEAYRFGTGQERQVAWYRLIVHNFDFIYACCCLRDVIADRLYPHYLDYTDYLIWQGREVVNNFLHGHYSPPPQLPEVWRGEISNPLQELLDNLVSY